MLHPHKRKSNIFAEALLKAHMQESEHLKIHLKGKGVQSIEALFLGNHGANSDIVLHLLGKAVKGNAVFRQNYFPDDPDYVDKEIQESPEFRDAVKLIEVEYTKLIKQLQQSGTFFSMRSIGHMLWDTAIPGILGYFAALLYNQNNVAAEASPVTTLLEMQVGNDLCKMLGYAVRPIGSKKMNINLNNRITGWGHITCDGSVANLEGLWMARNLKFYAASVKAAIQNDPALKAAESFTVKLLNGDEKPLVGLDAWTLLNLPVDEVLGISEAISKQYNLSADIVSSSINRYTVQNMGYHEVLMQFLPEVRNTPVGICSGTRHYSWPKGAAILGIGANNMVNVAIDLKARMDIEDLRKKLEHCLQTKTPVLCVVAIIGTTEESAVDPLHEILNIREEYRAKGLEFTIHADAAWGGYYKSMLNHDDDSDEVSFKKMSKKELNTLPMSNFVRQQYEVLQLADSITVDPHKSGYIPYPAGGLCYRNSAMRNLVSFTAPVVYHGGVDPTVGVYGVEGSKPGAAAAAVYLAHKLIRPNSDGYGKLSGACFFNVKRLYAALVCLNIQELPFFFVPLVPIPAIQNSSSPEDIQKQYEFIRDRIVNVTDGQLVADAEAFELFKELGGDQTIITYMYNYYLADGSVNDDMLKVNLFNDAIYKKFSYSPGEDNPEDTEIVVTSSSFTRAVDGDLIVDSLRGRLGVKKDENRDAPIDFIISTIMNPFLSSTLQGSFIPELISIIIRNVSEIALEQRNYKIGDYES